MVDRTNIIWEIWFIWATFLCWGQWLVVLVRLRTKHFNCLVNGCRKSGNSGQNCRQCRCFTFLFKVTDGGCTDTGIRCTHAENRRHGMWVDGNGNRRKPGSEASVGCNEVKTWPTWAMACQALPHPRKDIVIFLGTRVSSPADFKQRHKQSSVSSVLFTPGPCYEFCWAGAGRMERGSVSCFWGNRHPESATENRLGIEGIEWST